MKKNIPAGIDNFAKLIDKKNNYCFVDKSLFIREIIDDKSEVTLITRPRRWGKTLTMSMLQHFFSSKVLDIKTQGMFDQLAIAKVVNGEYLKEQGQYPVIFISFKDIKSDNFSGALAAIGHSITELYESYSYLLDSHHLTETVKARFLNYLKGNFQKEGIELSLKFLSHCLYDYQYLPEYSFSSVTPG